MKKNRKTIAIDFDGVIHKYSKGWQDGSIYDEPVEGTLEAIKKLQELGFLIIVFTTRKNTEVVSGWIYKKMGLLLSVTNEKPMAVAYIDDRGIRFEDWDTTIDKLIGYDVIKTEVGGEPSKYSYKRK